MVVGTSVGNDAKSGQTLSLGSGGNGAAFTPSKSVDSPDCASSCDLEASERTAPECLR